MCVCVLLYDGVHILLTTFPMLSFIMIREKKQYSANNARWKWRRKREELIRIALEARTWNSTYKWLSRRHSSAIRKKHCLKRVCASVALRLAFSAPHCHLCSKCLFLIYGVHRMHCNLTEGLKRTRRKSLNEIWTELTTGFCPAVFFHSLAFGWFRLCAAKQNRCIAKCNSLHL